MLRSISLGKIPGCPIKVDGSPPLQLDLPLSFPHIFKDVLLLFKYVDELIDPLSIFACFFNFIESLDNLDALLILFLLD